LEINMTSLAPEFMHDVFMSYSHGDPAKTGDALLKRWSEAFHDRLCRELRSLPDWPDADVFMDDGSLDRGDELEAQLRKAVVQSALFVVLMSPHYLRSEACKREREYWFDKIKSECYPEIASRQLIARVWPLADNGAWPREFCDEKGQPPLGVWFHEQPGNQNLTRPFGWKSSEDPAFIEAVVALAGDVSVRLQKLRKSIERKREAALNIEKLRAATGQAIYLYARGDDAPRWESACNELLGAGYGMVPDAPDLTPDRLLVSDQKSDSTRTLLACDGLLLVPGKNPSHLASDLVVVGHRWRNSAKATSKKPLPCAVLDFDRLAEAKPFLQKSARNMQVDWIDASSSDWVSGVRTWLNATADLASAGK
jgi:hypothetical protein